jgi:uncharacterized membrane protein YfcA
MAILHAFIIPIVLAVLSGMGLGGGGLFVIYLKLFAGGEQLEMQAINLLFFIFAAGASLTLHLLRRKIYVSAIILAASAGVVGSLIGSWIATIIKSDLLGVIFGLMLICAGIYSFFDKGAKKADRCGRVRQKTRDGRDIMGKMGNKSQKSQKCQKRGK